MHWILAGRVPILRSTTWFYAFHNFSLPTFDRESLVTELRDLCDRFSHWNKTSPVTIKRDVDCFIRSYVGQPGQGNSEDSREAVLVDLGLIRQVSTTQFQFNQGPKHSLPDGVFAFALYEFWKSFAPDQNTLAINSIIYEPGSPGRAFKLDEYSVNERLTRIDEISQGSFAWTDSAGIRNISRLNQKIDKWELLRTAYPDQTIQQAA